MENKEIKEQLKEIKALNELRVNQAVNEVLGNLNDWIIDNRHDDGDTINVDAILEEINRIIKQDDYEKEIYDLESFNYNWNDDLENCFTTIESEVEEIESSVESEIDSFKGYLGDFLGFATSLDNYASDETKIKFVQKIADSKDIESLPLSTLDLY